MKEIPSTILLASTLLCVVTAGAQQAPPPPADWQIEAKIQQVLREEHAFAGSTILSYVSKGTVKLTGGVHSEAEKELASTEIGQINGVKTVLNNLTIVDTTPHTPPPPKPPEGPSGPKTITLPVGTLISVRLHDEISTKTAKPNDTFSGTTAVSVTQNSFTAIPAGTPFTGRVAGTKSGTYLTGGAALSIELVSLHLPADKGSGSQDVSVLTHPLSSVIAGRMLDLKPGQLLQFHTVAPLDITIQLRNGHQVGTGTTEAPLP